MSQVYHSNATTNRKIREEIRYSNQSCSQLASKYFISEKTARKYRSRDIFEDKSSRPNYIKYSLNDIEKAVVISMRKSTWMSVDEINDLVNPLNNNYNQSNIYRTLRANGISVIPEEKKDEAKKFKEYTPGFIHMDVTYLPKLDGNKKYLFVAIDRATRSLFYKIYPNRDSKYANKFLKECKEFFPMIITHILTDNGGEFKNKEFVDNCKEDNIKLRNTKPYTPKTNGMVERVNSTIKDPTIKSKKYKNYDDLEIDLNRFLLYYYFNRKHGSLKKELNVRTPFDALEKWYKLEPDLFKISPKEFKDITIKKLEALFQEKRYNVVKIDTY